MQWDEHAVQGLTKGSGDSQHPPHPPGARPHHHTPRALNALPLICAVWLVVFRQGESCTLEHMLEQAQAFFILLAPSKTMPRHLVVKNNHVQDDACHEVQKRFGT